jgi:hypothetical protein
LIDLKTRAVAPFSPDARTFHNIYNLQKHDKEPYKFVVNKRQIQIIRFYLSLVRSVAYGESEVKLFACKEIINHGNFPQPNRFNKDWDHQ